MMLRLTSLLFLGLLLAGCAGQQPQVAPDAAWETRMQRLQQLDNWKATGKIALRTPAQSESASMIWVQQGHETYLNLSGPLGAGATSMRSDGAQLEIRRGSKVEHYDISTPEAIAAHTGWNLPLTSMPYWLRGVPSPGTHADEISVQGELLRHLRQDGWRISYERYQHFEQFTLPTLMRIEQSQSEAKVIIRDWSTAPQ